MEQVSSFPIHSVPRQSDFIDWMVDYRRKELCWLLIWKGCHVKIWQAPQVHQQSIVSQSLTDECVLALSVFSAESKPSIHTRSRAGGLKAFWQAALDKLRPLLIRDQVIEKCSLLPPFFWMHSSVCRWISWSQTFWSDFRLMKVWVAELGPECEAWRPYTKTHSMCGCFKEPLARPTYLVVVAFERSVKDIWFISLRGSFNPDGLEFDP